jgi:Putative transposase
MVTVWLGFGEQVNLPGEGAATRSREDGAYKSKGSTSTQTRGSPPTTGGGSRTCVATWAGLLCLSDARLAETSDGNLSLKLKRPWSDGTTHLILSPTELIEKLLPLVPRPRAHLTRYHGLC